MKGSGVIINFKVSLPDDFPPKLTILAKSLKHLGISEMAWNWENAIKTIEFLSENGYSILGGDVYKLVDGDLVATYDSWYFNKNEVESSQELLQESRNRAIAYINKYYKLNGQNYYYSIVFTPSRS